MNILPELFLGAIVLGLLVVIFIATYKVVDPNDAHVVVFMGRGRRLYAPKLTEHEGVESKKAKTSYFFIPLLMKRFILPLTNVKMDISNIHLNDAEVAPFVCDVITWLHISDPIQAAERLNLSEPFESLKEDLINIVQAVARAVSMKKEVLEIMRDRTSFSQLVSDEVGGILEKWGVELINLEVNDIRDDAEKESTIISDYESIRKAQIDSTARKEISIRDREAVEVEQQNIQKSKVAEAVSQEEYTKRQIEKDKNIGIRNAEKDKEVAEKMKEANISHVEALRATDVGKANVLREATVEEATGEAEAIRITGEKEANVVKLKGEAEGAAIEAKSTAEATAKLKMADAMAKFNDAATNIEKIRASIEVQKAMWEAYGKVASNAQIKVVNSGKGGNILGFPLNAETGADLGQMIEGFGGVEKITKTLKDNPKLAKTVEAIKTEFQKKKEDTNTKVDKNKDVSSPKNNN